MAYLNRHSAQRPGLSAELIALLLVVAAGASTAWMAARMVGVDLSGVQQAAAFLGIAQGTRPAVPVGAPAAASDGSRSAAFCPPGQTPRFALGFAALKALLGDAMGAPLECEHPTSADGDTAQRTTTGLAFYRKRTNTATFTDGWRHWALTPSGLVTWEGQSVDPPR